MQYNCSDVIHWCITRKQAGKACPFPRALRVRGLQVAGLCSSYCGFHSYGTLSTGGTLKYAFVGDPSTLCPDRECNANRWNNG